MDIREMQADVKCDVDIDFPDRSNADLKVMMLLGLSEEAGEVAGLGKRLVRGYAKDLQRATLDTFADEIGDVLWYILGLCNTLGLDLVDVWNHNRAKLEERYGHK